MVFVLCFQGNLLDFFYFQITPCFRDVVIQDKLIKNK